ncbi:glycosyltransferase [Ruania halotolerans]|nr:glycosyltransferase family 2 protein [Ruania halotolerans]UFU05727.1 glycosyltransferase [Ruania halotolerans]
MAAQTALDQSAAERSESAAHVPTVSVVIATRSRPELLRNAVRSILVQDYRGAVEVIAVFDQTEVDGLTDIAVPENRQLRTIPNGRTPGLAGGRNSGIIAATGTLIAFCDDDDEWLAGKLTAQLETWRTDPEAIGIATGIVIQSPGGRHVRVAEERLRFSDFVRSRVPEVHSSSVLWRRADLLGRIGLVDEELPASYGEDYDLLLRATKSGDLRCVPEPLVVVHWDRPSYFASKWHSIADGLTYLLRKHPELTGNALGTARICAQVAFAHAALGQRKDACRWVVATLRRDRTQLRAYAAMVVAARLVPAHVLVGWANRRGRGL